MYQSWLRKKILPYDSFESVRPSKIRLHLWSYPAQPPHRREGKRWMCEENSDSASDWSDTDLTSLRTESVWEFVSGDKTKSHFSTVDIELLLERLPP